ncbi:MAG: class I SAM-dependent methyltransferase [Proteobacteria bacterium]|nr:class I SAM-dependent methyltransferase [Pseudomonadota bacterium]MDA1300420.1 class I SAM-dependent methyltransferase [Pseudomonadota bacterium]
MGLYQRYLLPALINSAMKAPPMKRIRSELVPQARGRVLEVGIGSGLNLPFYAPGIAITGLDPNTELQVYARETAARARMTVDFIARSGEDIPADDNTFDTVVITWTLCSIPMPEKALAEMHRVLKPAGKLIFAEHGLAPEPQVSRWQHRINPLWKAIGGGCHLNRKMDTLIKGAGFDFDRLVEGYVEGPKFAAYMYRGIARPS